MNLYKGKTIFITGATRGIGKEIALKLATEGANIVIAAKSVEENPKLGGTIYSTAKDIEQAGGKALAIQTDIRFEDQIERAVKQSVEKFGGIDVLINNASAINLSPTDILEPKRFDLLFDINVRGTFFVTQYCLPYLAKGNNPHIITLSPPLKMAPNCFSKHVAYTMSKYNMSLMTIGWAEEFKKKGIACNAIWPAKIINTAAIRNVMPNGSEIAKYARSPKIVADAVFHLLSKTNLSCTGNLFLDEEILTEAGMKDFSQYADLPSNQLIDDDICRW
ncbi:MAG: NAD(P)-dependent oxidoreductase [Phycisphaerales bacterium]|nr:NAD(P)-dependent oxidoreductase [Phycisphaerales bacterium]